MSQQSALHSEIPAHNCQASLLGASSSARRICWRDTRTQTALAALSADGLSAGAIAQMLGCSRDQVAGAMRRYGLFARG